MAAQQDEALPCFPAGPMGVNSLEAERERLHARHVNPALDLLGPTLLRKREFDLIQSTQKAWVPGSGAPPPRALTKQLQDKGKQKQKRQRQGKGASPQSVSKLPFLTNPSAEAVTRKAREEFASNGPRLLQASVVLGSSSHMAVWRAKQEALKRAPKSAPKQHNYAVLEFMTSKAELEILCHCNVACKRGTAAVIKCFSCIKYDPLMLGHFCEACFAARHPKFRVKHQFVRIGEDAKPQKQHWQAHMERLDRERRELEVKHVLEDLRGPESVREPAQAEPTRTRVEEENKAQDMQERIAAAKRTFVFADATLSRLRSRLPKDYSPSEAATKLQRMFRARRAQAEMLKVLRRATTKHTDEATGKTYFHNSVTGVSTFDRPKVLERAALTLSKTEAASMIQGCFRRSRARHRFRQLMLLHVEKHRDEETGREYLFNARTQQTCWVDDESGFASAAEVLTPRTRQKRLAVQLKKQQGVFKDASCLTEAAAASMIQGCFRRSRARHRFRQLMLLHVEKHRDEETGREYLFNAKTQQTCWVDDESGFASAAEVLTPRTRQKRLAVQLKKQQGVFKDASCLTEAAAASMIQARFRGRKERLATQNALLRCLRAVQDGDETYFVNVETGETMWKPGLLRDVSSSQIAAFEPATAEAEPEAEPDIEVRKRTPRTYESREEAASALQGMYRRKRARDRLRMLLLCNVEKHYDEANDVFYFVNVHTNEASWTRPAMLDESDILTPRTRERLAEVQRKKDAGTFQSADSMTEEDAALLLQRAYRAGRCRRAVLELLLKTVAKATDEDGTLYYVNLRTNEATFAKPKLLRELSGRALTSYRTLTLQNAEEKEKEKVKMKEEERQHRPKRDGPPLTDEEAASKLQAMYRRKVARDRIRNLLLCHVQKAVDADGNEFFWNTLTGSSSWEPPALLAGHEVLTPRRRKQKLLAEERREQGLFRTAATLTDDEAAVMVQRRYRAGKCRSMLRAALLESVVRATDPTSGAVYFINTDTGAATWTAPPLLDESDILTPRANQRRAEVQRKKDAGTFKSADSMSEEDAALLLQRVYRAGRGRRAVLELLLKTVAKATDDDGILYYVNLRSMEATYVKPKLLRELSGRALTSFRSLELQKEKEEKEKEEKEKEKEEKEEEAKEEEEEEGHHAPKSDRPPLTDEEAASKLQAMYRRKVARDRIRNLLLCHVQKAVDADGNEFFWNTLTGSSSWEPPALLAGHEVLTPRRRKQKLLAEERREQGLFRTAATLTDDEAAVMVQRRYRAGKCRSMLRAALLESVVRATDPTSGAVYFINTDTGAATWTKPTMLRDLSDGKLASYKEDT